MGITGIDRSRVRRGRRGDSIISLRRGLAGKRSSHVKIVQSLGLSRPGDQNLGFADDPCRMGQYRKAQHLLDFVQLDSVEDLDEDEEPHISTVRERPSFSAGRADELVKTPRQENPSPTRGRVIDFQDMQFVRSQVRDAHSCTITWSSPVKLQDFLRKVGEIIPLETGGHARISNLDDGEELDGVTETFFERAIAISPGALACRAEFHGAVAYWQSADATRQLVDETAEVGLVFEKSEMPDIAYLMQRTGTAAVKGWAESNASVIEATLLDA